MHSFTFTAFALSGSQPGCSCTHHTVQKKQLRQALYGVSLVPLTVHTRSVCLLIGPSWPLNSNIPILLISSLNFASKSYRPLLWCPYTKEIDLDPGDLWPWDFGNKATWWFSLHGSSNSAVVLSLCMVVLSVVKMLTFRMLTFQKPYEEERDHEICKPKRPSCGGA